MLGHAGSVVGCWVGRWKGKSEKLVEEFEEAENERVSARAGEP